MAAEWYFDLMEFYAKNVEARTNEKFVSLDFSNSSKMPNDFIFQFLAKIDTKNANNRIV